MGTQMLDSYPHSRYEGVTAFWYGKGPGVDRSGDALKHANFAGTSQNGAVVVLSGEDHEAKSSTMPFQQEWAFVSAGIPVLYPSSVSEFVTMGLHAVALSRYSGCWVALKLVSQLCDGGETVDLDHSSVQPVIPDAVANGEAFQKRADFSFFPGRNLDIERHLYQERHAAVLRYARANSLNRIVAKSATDRIGIITAGKTAVDVQHALADLGIPIPALDRGGISLLKVGMLYPLDPRIIQEFSAGLDEIIVVEEKRGFLEDAVRQHLQPLGRPIRVVGKTTGEGSALFPVHGAMDSDLVAELLDRHLPTTVNRDSTRREALAEIHARNYAAHEARTPNFCSGCPHSHSTVLGEGQIALGAPGCNCFNTVIEQPSRHIDTVTQYGGEGLPWIGLSAFTDRDHIIQHVGDGSIYHSSYLNIRFAVAAGVSMTFKILYNAAVANTGAQEAVGQRGVAALTRSLSAEGVAQIVVVSKEPGSYSRRDLGERTTVRKAHELQAVSKELESVAGVTVLIYDEKCANERRRLQKRGRLPKPSKYAYINPLVCENCGDCGTKSNCMSLHKVQTEFGPKTSIHASSCNQDFSCFQGDCPSFLSVSTQNEAGYRRPNLSLPEGGLPAPPAPDLRGHFNLYIPGVGGTGVITVNAMLAVAAQIDGHDVLTYDQTGAAQKWGTVVSSLTFSPKGGGVRANKVPAGAADLYLALDLLAGASPANLDRCHPDRTALLLNTDVLPTGAEIRDITRQLNSDAMAETIRRYTNSQARVEIPARALAEAFFGDYMLTNIVALGAAIQAGLLPLHIHSVEQAIRLNGVNVSDSLAALACGRWWVHDASRLIEIVNPPQKSAAQTREDYLGKLGGRKARAYTAMQDSASARGEESRRLLAVRLGELIDYQSVEYAKRYLATVEKVLCAERDLDGSERLGQVVIRNLYKLMAYKDEYEVARLHLDADFRRSLDETFDRPIRVSYNFHPPMFRRLGLDRKVEFGPWFARVLWLLKTARRLRGTPFDMFRFQASRREERELIVWYETLVGEVLALLRPSNLNAAEELLELPDTIRGYESIKTNNAKAARDRAQTLLRLLNQPEAFRTVRPA